MARGRPSPNFATRASVSIDTPVAANWASSGSTGTPSFADTAIPAPGTLLAPPTIGAPASGLLISNGSAASQTNLIRTFGAAVDVSAASYIDVLVYWPNIPVGNTFSLYLDSTGSNFTNYYLATLNGALTGTQKRGWNSYRIHKSSFGVGAGAPSWANITRLQVRLSTPAGADAFYLCQISAGYPSRAKLLVTLDDGPISQFAAIQEANAAGIKCTINIVPSLVISGGGSTYMSVANLQTLLAAGNAIQTHGWDHTSFIDQPDGGAADVLRQREWLAAVGLGPANNPGFYHHAFVQGDHNAKVDDAMRRAGVLSARAVRGSAYSAGPPERYEQTTSWDQQNGCFGLVDPYSLNCLALDNTTVTAPVALVALTKAAAHGVSLWTYCHVISNADADFSAANWTAFINGAKTLIGLGLVDPITQPQYFAQIQNGRIAG